METNVNTEVLKLQTALEKKQENSTGFKPFSWMRGELQSPENDLLGLAKDVASGVALAMQMVEQSKNHREDGDSVLSAPDCGIFERFSISACLLLNKAIDQHFEWRFDFQQEGK